MKRLMLFLQEVLDDLGTWCGTSADLDLKTIKVRVEHEGLSFLTIALPNFGRDFEKSLDQGFVADDHFAGFSRRGGLPRFLGGFLQLVFDARTGRLLDDPSIEAIRAIRQITLMFGKILLPCSPERERKAIDKYVECESIVREFDRQLNLSQLEEFGRVSTLLWSEVMTDVDSDVYYGRLMPKHGPGSTADALVGNDKWRQTEWTERLERILPSGEFLIPNPSYYQQLDAVRLLEPGQERPVKVVLVPKTLKTPRVIAMEPTCMQYAQQAIMGSLVSAIERFDTSRKLIGFESVLPNQKLALEGSREGTYATLDLSDASDRVSNQLVRHMLRNHGSLREAVDASRSRKADVPGHGVIRLAKFASMGSALTFPIEAMVFCTIVFVGIQRELNRPLSKRDIKSLEDRVRVYGDDIVIPTEFVPSVVRALEDFGLLVNLNKSFWNGKFRETCGREFYDGHEVSITRVRRAFPTDRLQTAELVSLVELRNHLYLGGLWKATRYLDTLLERLCIPLPTVLETSPVLGRRSFLGYETQKVDRHLHRPLVKGLLVKAVLQESPLDEHYALLKVLATRGEVANPDVRHLQFAGRPRTVSTMTRWTTPY